MDTIENVAQFDYFIVILGFFAILFALKEAMEIIGWFKNKFRVKTGVEQDKETLEERIATLEKHDKWQYNEISKISNGIEEIKERLLNKEIEDMRKTILDFCSSLASGQKQNKEAFDYIFKVHQHYDELLEDLHRENNVINESMKFISDKYQEFLRTGIDK